MQIDSSMMPTSDIFDQNALDNLPKSKEAKIKAVSAAFASIFINEVLQTSRKSDLGVGKGFFDSNQTKMMQKLYYQEMASTISGNDSFGITHMIENEIKSEER